MRCAPVVRTGQAPIRTPMTRAQHGQRRLHVRVWHAGVPQVQTRLCRGAQVVAGHGRQAQPELTGDASAVRIVGFRGSPIGAAQEVIQGHCGIVQVDELHVHPCEQILGSQATFRRTRVGGYQKARLSGEQAREGDALLLGVTVR